MLDGSESARYHEAIRKVIGPQPGPQFNFLASDADIAIYGGSAGSGKSYGLLLDPLHYVSSVPGFYATIFRRTIPQIKKQGSLWDQSMELYGQLPEARPTAGDLKWTWTKGGRVEMHGLEHETDVLNYHGAQIPCLLFDELTLFTRYQFFYMLSRNRSTCRVKPYMRATCNPDADSWVAEFIAWWIDQETGFPIPERSGVLRYFVRAGDKIVWADKPDDLKPELLGLPTHNEEGKELEYLPKSVTFIPAKIFDNQELLRANPEYLSTLLALDRVERMRLLDGNWKIKPAPGLYFNRSWCEVIEPHEVPAKLNVIRGWDLAGTDKTDSNKPDKTVGVKIGRDLKTKIFYVLHATWLQGSPHKVETLIKNTASQDGRDVEIHLPQDPGQAGKFQAIYFVQEFGGYTVRTGLETGDKSKRFSPFSSQAEHHMVKVVRGDWNDDWFSHLEAFPESDDHADATSRAFNGFFTSTTGLIDYMGQQLDALELRKAEARKEQEPPSLAKGGVRVKGPPNVNVLYDMKGKPLFCDEEGTFIVDPKHWEALKRTPEFKQVLANGGDHS